MSAYHMEHCMDPLDERPAERVKRVQTLGIYPNVWRARRALSELVGDSPAEGYHVCETERGFEVVREP